MTLRQKQLKALNQSIKHWEQNCINVEQGDDPSINASYCACCNVFDTYGDCYECPIEEASESKACEDTPYFMVTEAEEHKELLAACLLEYMFLLNVREYLLS